MTLYKITSGKLRRLKEAKINLEKDIQSLTEHNLQDVFNLSFISTEFERNRLRIDTLAFDEEAGAFVIIEYKRDRSFSIVDQGYAYLSLLLNNKAEFILEYNERTGKTLRRDRVDWSQSRVIFVANSFTTHQRHAINFHDLPIELWEVEKYEDDLIGFTQLKPNDTSASIKTISKNATIQEVSKEVKVYSVDDHFAGSRESTRSLYEQFREQLLLSLPELHENPRRNYIGFSLAQGGSDTLAYVHVKVGYLSIDIPRIVPDDIPDPLKLLEFQEKSLRHKNTPVSMIRLADEDSIDYVAGLLKAVYKHTHDA